MPPARTLLIGVLIAAWPGPPAALGQVINIERPVVLGGPASRGPTAPTAPTLNTVGARARRVLAQFDALTAPPADQPNKQAAAQDPTDEAIDWDEALGLLEDLIVDNQRSVIPAAEPGRFIPLGEHCHLRITALSAEGLQAYRDRVDATARRLLQEGRDRNDAVTVRRVAEEFFCSSSGDDALLLLGDLALERGDTLTAVRCWRRIHPAASDPLGRPLAWSLRGVDLQQQGAKVAEILNASPGTGLVHPDSDVPIGEVLARLALASLYDEDLAAAKTYAKTLELLDPLASGVLAGRSGRLSPIIDQVIASAQSWPQTDQPKIGSLVGRVWPKPIALATPRQPPVRRPQLLIVGGGFQGVRPPPATRPTPGVLPTITGGKLVYREGQSLRAVDLATGELSLGPQGLLFKPTPSAAVARPGDAQARQRVIVRGNALGRLPPFPANEPMTVVGDRLLARVVSPAAGRPFGAPAIRSFDLTREGLESPVVEPTDTPWKIGGPAVADASRVYLPIVDHQSTTQIALAAFSLSTGRELWRTPIATAPAPSAYGAAAAPRVGVTLACETLLVNTNLGAIAAIDKRTGAPHWVRLYDRSAPDPAAAPSPHQQGEAPGVLAGGRLFVAPTDSDQVLALDAATGRRLWAAPAFEGAHHLLGVAGRTLAVGGDRLRGLDIDTGRSRYVWPESRKAGIRGAGRGCLVAGEVFWPTRDRVLVFDAERGVQSRRSLDIADLGGAGANLVPAGELLVAAGVNRMTVFGSVNRETKNNPPLLSQLELKPQMHTDSHR